MESDMLNGEMHDGNPEAPEKIQLHIKAYTHAHFNQVYKRQTRETQSTSTCQKISKSCVCTKRTVVSSITNKLPIISTLRNYKIKEMLLPDILAGISVAVLHIPMGMGFGLLASLTPIYGLYTSFFPVVMYALFGTSHHTSFGSNAIIAVIVASVAEKQASLHTFSQLNGTGLAMTDAELSLLTNQSGYQPSYVISADMIASSEHLHLKASVAAASSLVVGVILALMGLLHLGILSIFFSDPLVSGFTFGTALQIAVLQAIKLLGLHLPSRVGTFKLFLTIQDIFTNIKSTNIAALVMSCVCLIVLILVKECINKRFKNKLPVPIPIDFFVVLVATIISHFANFSDRFNLPIVDKVPAGLTAPSIPDLKVIPAIAMDSFVIAILVFAISLSVAKFLAKQMQYHIDENQELLAYGASNIFGGFFQCFPSCQAPPRAMMSASMKARTTVTGLISALVVLVILLKLGQYMEALPVCVLAAMIIVSLSGLFRNVLDTKRLWDMNKWDFTIWVVSAAVTSIVDIDIGLYAGVGISLVAVVLQTRQSSGVLLGRTEAEDYIIDVNSSDKVREIPGVKIFQFRAPMYFGNADMFKEHLYKLAVDPDLPHHHAEVIVQPEHLDNAETTPMMSVKDTNDKQSTNGEVQRTSLELLDQNSAKEEDIYISDPVLGPQPMNEVPIHTIILDLSRVTYIDSTALKTIELVVESYDIVGIRVLFADCNPLVYSSLRKVQYFRSLPDNRFAHDAHAAIVLSQKCSDS